MFQSLNNLCNTALPNKVKSRRGVLCLYGRLGWVHSLRYGLLGSLLKTKPPFGSKRKLLLAKPFAILTFLFLKLWVPRKNSGFLESEFQIAIKGTRHACRKNPGPLSADRCTYSVFI